MLLTAPLTAHVNRWVIQLSSYCGVNELGSTVWVCIFALFVCMCACVCERERVCVCIPRRKPRGQMVGSDADWHTVTKRLHTQWLPLKRRGGGVRKRDIWKRWGRNIDGSRSMHGKCETSRRRKMGKNSEGCRFFLSRSREGRNGGREMKSL